MSAAARKKSALDRRLKELEKEAGLVRSDMRTLSRALKRSDEGIALDHHGFVSEGSGENIFVVRNGSIYTPPSSSSILPGITRHCVITLARELGLQIRQQVIPREALYVADEVFFSGTAAEVTPVSKIDHIVIGNGKRGPVTERIQSAFFDIVEGRAPDTYGWFTPVT